MYVCYIDESGHCGKKYNPKQPVEVLCGVPAAHIKNSLRLNFVAVPKAGKQYGEKGWLFAILARMLEDENLLVDFT